ncbi:MAG: hypothetical protein EXR52_06390, partial [Dehalococcoidia bacterium]|nr:hypothetical protein [Dehalococcoidia bacterium]
MANIVLGFGSSHGPTMNTPPERWPELGERDQADTRFDFASLRANPDPKVVAQVNLAKFTERYEALQRDVIALNDVMVAAQPDVVIVISNPHGGVTTDLMQPTFGIHLNDAPPMTEGPRLPSGLGGEQAGRLGAPAATTTPPKHAYPTDSDLARHLMEGLVDEGFDLAANFQSNPGAGLDGAYNLLYQRFDVKEQVPYVPVLVSRYLPNQATPKRCYQFGQALRKVVHA